MCYEALVALELEADTPLVDFLTPVCKVFCTDAGVLCADLGVQVLGGYGYLAEYLVEQTLRDARICRIYEGTNEIHALTVAGRLLTHANGAAADSFDAFVTQAKAFGSQQAGAAVVEQCLAAWRTARKAVSASPDFSIHAQAFMKLTGLTAFAAVWLKLAAAADAAPDPSRIRRLARFTRFYVATETRLWAERCAGQ
jgi:hypothetical protein